MMLSDELQPNGGQMLLVCDERLVMITIPIPHDAVVPLSSELQGHQQVSEHRGTFSRPWFTIFSLFLK